MITNSSIAICHYDEDSDTYIEQEFKNASVSGVTEIGAYKGCHERRSNYIIRIPTDEDILIACGDKVRSDTAFDKLTVVGFSDNRRGTRAVRHWRIEVR